MVIFQGRDDRVSGGTARVQIRMAPFGRYQLGLPNLGNTTTVAIYRPGSSLCGMRPSRRLTSWTVARIFYDAGLSSEALYENMLGSPRSLDDFIAKLQAVLLDLNIGILRVEVAHARQLHFIFTVAGIFWDCSGLPAIDEAICNFRWEGVHCRERWSPLFPGCLSM